MLVIRAVFTVYFPFLWRNIWEKDMCGGCACGQECLKVLHGHVPLMTMNHKVLQSCGWAL